MYEVWFRRPIQAEVHLFTVQKFKRYKNGLMDFSLLFNALKNKLVSFSKAMFEAGPLCLQCDLFDDKVLPEGCEIIEKVPSC